MSFLKFLSLRLPARIQSILLQKTPQTNETSKNFVPWDFNTHDLLIDGWISIAFCWWWNHYQWKRSKAENRSRLKHPWKTVQVMNMIQAMLMLMRWRCSRWNQYIRFQCFNELDKAKIFEIYHRELADYTDFTAIWKERCQCAACCIHIMCHELGRHLTYLQYCDSNFNNNALQFEHKNYRHSFHAATNHKNYVEPMAVGFPGKCLVEEIRHIFFFLITCSLETLFTLFCSFQITQDKYWN